jgi:hypothetical protein
MSSISHIPNIELQEAIRLRDWIGWKVGWLTGWYNPIDRLGDVINPAELGRLIEVQGRFMEQQGKLVQGFGEELAKFTAGGAVLRQEKQQG